MKLSAVILALALAAGGAHAQGTASAEDPQSVLDQFTALGFEASLDPYESGRPRIVSKIVGVNYAVAFYSCYDDMTGCEGLMFTAGFDMSEPTGSDVVNEWNETRVYSRAFLDEEDDPYVQMPVPVARTLSQADVRRLVDIWESEVVKFTDKIGFNRPDDAAPASSDPVAPDPPATPAPAGRVGPKKAPSASSFGKKDQ
jgi:hypothetical protein